MENCRRGAGGGVGGVLIYLIFCRRRLAIALQTLYMIVTKEHVGGRKEGKNSLACSLSKKPILNTSGQQQQRRRERQD